MLIDYGLASRHQHMQAYGQACVKLLISASIICIMYIIKSANCSETFSSARPNYIGTGGGGGGGW